jgi:hypothetical protein
MYSSSKTAEENRSRSSVLGVLGSLFGFILVYRLLDTVHTKVWTRGRLLSSREAAVIIVPETCNVLIEDIA